MTAGRVSCTAPGKICFSNHRCHPDSAQQWIMCGFLFFFFVLFVLVAVKFLVGKYKEEN